MTYSGPRPIFPVLDGDDNVNPYTGEVEKYSNWSIFNTSHLLEGTPRNNHVPGEGRHPHGLKMSRLFEGLEDAEQPLDGPGLGARQTYDGRYGPLENKAAGNNKVFKAVYGHAPGTPVEGTGQLYWWSNFEYAGLDESKQLVDPGHAARAIGATGTANTFGRFNPNDPSGRNDSEIADGTFGKAVPATSDSEQIGFNKVNEWHGVTSAKALNV